ncbi:hypothetical protein BURKHO8Y_580011 [Burkholderia sp. 8Y]|nr:hypothetical protein BURKHO8Y_580011 [Burkholderia sp. 8Y]
MRSYSCRCGRLLAGTRLGKKVRRGYPTHMNGQVVKLFRGKNGGFSSNVKTIHGFIAQ